MRRTLEIATPTGAASIVVAVAATSDAPGWAAVLAFAAMVVLAENFDVAIHRGASLSPGFMITMASIAVLDRGPGMLIGAALVGAGGGLYWPHIRARRFGIIAFNCGQYGLATIAAAAAYAAFPTQPQLLALVAVLAATAAFTVVNVALVVPYVARTQHEPMARLWPDYRRALPNYLAWGLLGLMIGLVCAELGALAIVLLAVPMGIGRWIFRSFERSRDAQEATVRLFVRLIEAKDPYTAGHTERVATYSLYIGEALGLPADRLDHLRQSALVHDIGKLAVPLALLNKPGRLTPEEWEVVRSHNDAGVDILAQVDFMRTMAVTASDRHGRFDRPGDETTPADLVLEAHIVAVADAFDAMTSTRPYRKALSQAVAFEELRAHAGSQFNPTCVDALVTAIEQRGETYGAGYEVDVVPFAVTPPEVGVGSAGLGDLDVAQ